MTKTFLEYFQELGFKSVTVEEHGPYLTFIDNSLDCINEKDPKLVKLIDGDGCFFARVPIKTKNGVEIGLLVDHQTELPDTQRDFNDHLHKLQQDITSPKAGFVFGDHFLPTYTGEYFV